MQNSGPGKLNPRTWDEMLEEFRALGGVADNIRMGEGALGRGLFAVDPARPARLHVPENLLIGLTDVAFESGALRVVSQAGVGARERAFFENYQAHLSWGAGGRVEIEGIFAQAQSLPADLRHELTVKHRCGTWFDEASQSAFEQQFLQSRHIEYQGRMVLMPVMDLVNHGPGPAFRLKDGIGIDGTWPGEITVRYADTDAYGAFQAWGFTCEEPVAFSIELLGNIGQTRLHIERQLGETKSGPRQWVPRYAQREGDGVLNFLMLGNRQYPRICKGIFYKTMQNAGLDGYEEAFDTIQHVNRMHFLSLLEALENVDGAMAQTLRRMARYQLQALSFGFGVRML
ncbi:MAG TPA: hypothetical protein VMF58_08025 [Rhizomicrobium sp.]|nr:hypothetical protein [Rhizomicrobium sp.]